MAKPNTWRTKKFGKGNPLLAETLALRLGVWEARKLEIKKVRFEGDCQTLINIMKKKVVCPWNIDILVSDIRNSLLYFESVTFSFISRKINIVADFLSKMGHYNFSSIHSNLKLKALILWDALGRPPD